MLAEDFLNTFEKLGLCTKTETPDRGVKVRYDFKVDEGFCSVAELCILEELGTDMSHVEINNYFNHDEDKMEFEVSFSIKDDAT
jgi:hypothetical protein